jgi:hypothetical protein
MEAGKQAETDSTKNRVAKEAAKRAMRNFANRSIRYNKLMKDENKGYYGIRPADHTQTPGMESETYPEAEADTSVIRQIRIHFWDSAMKKRGLVPRDTQRGSPLGDPQPHPGIGERQGPGQVHCRARYTQGGAGEPGHYMMERLGLPGGNRFC